MLKNSLFQPSLSFSFSAAVLFPFLFLPFSVSALPLCFFFFLPFFSFQFTCALFFQPKNTFFSPKRFCFSPKPFSVQPTPLFQLLFLFVGSVFSASFSSFFFSASFSFSCQLPRPKIFSLDASHFFYLNKSLFSSNLE